MIDQATLQDIESKIAAGVATAATIGEAVAPQYTPFIILGQALAASIPSLLDDVNAILTGKEPDAAANAALALKIASLDNPETL